MEWRLLLARLMRAELFENRTPVPHFAYSPIACSKLYSACSIRGGLRCACDFASRRYAPKLNKPLSESDDKFSSRRTRTRFVARNTTRTQSKNCVRMC